MELFNEKTIESIEKAIFKKLNGKEAKSWIKNQSLPYRELMAYYKCAMMEVETKFRVLNEELSLGEDNNPIESIKARLKSPESILNKLERNGYPLNVESIKENITDIAGIRVICSFTSDIYMLADALLMQDDVRLIEKKDYISNPKPNGYRSLHLIVEIPIFLHNKKQFMNVEVQLRTVAMDTWASLEHKIKYKKDDVTLSEEVDGHLIECANLSAELDRRMEIIKACSSERLNPAGRTDF